MGVARVTGATLAAAGLLLLIGAPSTTQAATPPNPNDPCATGTVNSCGTTGVGFYRTYSFGTRWFGDFRGLVPGRPHMYCIDLRFWYPGPDYAYREIEAAGLRNRDGEAVPVSSLQRIAYAIWTYGRTTNADTAAATMLYVHAQMGDARPGELDPTAIGPQVATLYRSIARAADRFHGPYRVDVALPSDIGAGKTAAATIRVLSAAGAALPDLELSLSATGAAGVPAAVRTKANGVATVQVRGTGGGVHLTATTEPLASTLPRIYAPSKPIPARNAQRLAASESQRVSNTDVATGTKAQLSVTTKATATVVAAGTRTTDTVTIAGALPTYQQKVEVRLYGPFRTRAAITCTGTPAFETSFTAHGSGTYTSSPVILTRPGYYQYQEVAPPDASHNGFTTQCNVQVEQVLVQARPTLHTVATPTTVAPGGTVTDTVTVSGLGGEHVTIQAALYGPFPARDAIGCTGTPIWTGTIDVAADGDYHTTPYTAAKPGYYTYYESIAATELVRAVKTPCADVAETVIVTGTPSLRTVVSSQRTRPGGTVTDRIVVQGLGALALPIEVSLYGPFPTRREIVCTGGPAWHGSVIAKGDGTYTSPPARIAKTGYYTYRESIAASPASVAAQTPCGEAAETTLSHAQPTVTTLASDEVVYPRSSIYDRVRVTGLGATAARIRVDLFGPFSTRAAITCSRRPHGSVVVTAHGDSVLRTPRFQLGKAGFYSFRERLIGSSLVSEFATPCAAVSETSLGAAEIVTGRGDVAHTVQVPSGASAPVRVRIASLGIDAPVSAVGIDVARGVLGVPAPIHRTGWWKDGAAPGARTGSILIAGHVDSATGGVGAFFRLHEAPRGTLVTVRTRAGRIFTYRVVSVRNYPKSRLPTSVWSLRGRPRLVLVTCGGPFIAAEGHYRDNVVLTAVPA